jgi:hypothetical protein
MQVVAPPIGQGNSTVALRTSGAPTLQVTGAGTALDIALRLVAPLLLGLAVLAVRGRIKR